MDETKVYIKGKPGFKPAVKTKLGGTWIHGDSDVSVDTMMFSLPEDSQLGAFKTSIGQKLISTYGLQFLTDLPEEGDPQMTKPESENSFTMSIWANTDSKITGRKTQKTQHDPGTEVVL